MCLERGFREGLSCGFGAPLERGKNESVRGIFGPTQVLVWLQTRFIDSVLFIEGAGGASVNPPPLQTSPPPSGALLSHILTCARSSTPPRRCLARRVFEAQHLYRALGSPVGLSRRKKKKKKNLIMPMLCWGILRFAGEETKVPFYLRKLTASLQIQC